MIPMKTKTDFQAFGAAVASWIAERTGEPVSASACADKLATGEAIITAFNPELQTLLIVMQSVELRSPPLSAAWRAGA